VLLHDVSPNFSFWDSNSPFTATDPTQLALIIALILLLCLLCCLLFLMREALARRQKKSRRSTEGSGGTSKPHSSGSGPTVRSKLGASGGYGALTPRPTKSARSSAVSKPGVLSKKLSKQSSTGAKQSGEFTSQRKSQSAKKSARSSSLNKPGVLTKLKTKSKFAKKDRSARSSFARSKSHKLSKRSSVSPHSGQNPTTNRSSVPKR